MKTLLGLAFLAGALAGVLGGVVLGLLLAKRRTARAIRGMVLADGSPAPDEPDAAVFPSDANFDAIAMALVDRCSARVQLQCALVMRDREGAAPRIVMVSEGLDARMVGLEVPLDTPAGRAILEGVPVVGAADEPVVQTATRDRRRAVTGGVSVPISQGSLVLGAVVAFGVPPAGGGDAVHGLGALVRLFTPQLLPAHAISLATRRAETDDLTGLPNRRALASAMAAVTTEPAALVLLDIDHFKKINDTLGHPAGDAALKHLGRLLAAAVRPKDRAARVGGEEFAVWLPGASLATAVEVAERLRAQVEATPFRWESEPRALTISCGVAAFPRPTPARDNLMVTADAALYRAKNAGRNQVVAAGVELAEGAQPL